MPKFVNFNSGESNLRNLNHGEDLFMKNLKRTENPNEINSQQYSYKQNPEKQNQNQSEITKKVFFNKELNEKEIWNSCLKADDHNDEVRPKKQERKISGNESKVESVIQKKSLGEIFAKK